MTPTTGVYYNGNEIGNTYGNHNNFAISNVSYVTPITDFVPLTTNTNLSKAGQPTTTIIRYSNRTGNPEKLPTKTVYQYREPIIRKATESITRNAVTQQILHTTIGNGLPPTSTYHKTNTTIVRTVEAPINQPNSEYNYTRTIQTTNRMPTSQYQPPQSNHGLIVTNEAYNLHTPTKTSSMNNQLGVSENPIPLHSLYLNESPENSNNSQPNFHDPSTMPKFVENSSPIHGFQKQDQSYYIASSSNPPTPLLQDSSFHPEMQDPSQQIDYIKNLMTPQQLPPRGYRQNSSFTLGQQKPRSLSRSRDQTPQNPMESMTVEDF